MAHEQDRVDDEDGKGWVGVGMGGSGIERYGHLNQPTTDTGSIAVRLSR